MVRKYDFEELYIEVGRRCNISCSHCNRGPSEYKSIDTHVISKLFSKTLHIDTLHITGGEPFLYPQVISHIANNLKSYHIRLGSFKIETNGMVEDYDVIKSLADLYALSENKDKCELTISCDKYHKEFAYPFQSETTFAHVLDILSFRKYETNIKLSDMYDEGYASANKLGAMLSISDTAPNITVSPDNDNIIMITNGTIYLNANGDILTNANYSYERQEYHIKGKLSQEDPDYIFTCMQKHA